MKVLREMEVIAGRKVVVHGHAKVRGNDFCRYWKMKVRVRVGLCMVGCGEIFGI